MPTGGVETPIPASVFARLSAATRYVITGAGPESWFGPQQPLVPQAPPEVKGRQWDYPFGVNLNYVPRSDNLLSFGELRALSDALPLLRTVIETRKDQIAALNWTIRPRFSGGDAAGRCAALRAFLATPDRRHDFATWLRMLVEDMLVIDAATIYPRYARSGAVYSLDVIDGATIKPLIGEDGRSPASPDPAYQQVLHGVPAADFADDELLYLPRNLRSHRLYGFSPVEQIALTINIALRREQATLDYYNTGSIPDSFATLPKDWTVDQIRQFQDYFDALMSGNLARRRMVKFMPAEFKLTETRQPPLKDLYDEWLARVICYAFSVPASAFVTQVNRATSQTLRTQAATEGLVPLKAWVKTALDRMIALCFRAPDLEFCWVGDDAIDPLEQAQTIAILVNAGVKTVAEARAELGLGQASGVVKGNPYHDERGQFTDADHAVEPETHQPVKPNRGVQVAENDPRLSRPGMATEVTSRPAGIETPLHSRGVEVVGGNPRPPSLGVDKYSVRLGEEEDYWGGHGVKDHVAIPADQLTSELLKTAQPSPDGGFAIKQSGEGSYNSLSDANDLVNRLLERNQAACDMVASGQWDSDWLNGRFGYPTGYEAYVTTNGDIEIR
jgi:hypothetical protein